VIQSARRELGKVELDFGRPGKPVDNAFAEAFNGAVRREGLSQHCSVSLVDAQQTLDAGRDDDNNARPHGSLANEPPAEYRREAHFVPDRDRIENSLRAPNLEEFSE
jgi:transposase InsO family protein